MAQKIRNLAIVAPLSAILGVLMIAGAGCVEHRPPDELAQAVSMGERPVAMSGSGTFFGDKLTATVTISRGIGRGVVQGKGSGRQHSRDYGDKAEIPDLSSMENADANAYIRAKIAVGSPMPPVTLHLKLNNVGKDTVSVGVIDFNSDLGNFAVHPDILSLAPEQAAEPDPMISQLGVTSDEIAVKVTLKLGPKTESQTILVKSLPLSSSPVK